MYLHVALRTVIKLNYLFESLNKIGLVKRLDAKLRLRVNTGTVNVTVAGADSTNLVYNLTPANNTFLTHALYLSIIRLLVLAPV
jgi:hypothetical protein